MTIQKLCIYFFILVSCTICHGAEKLVIEPDAGREPILNAIQNAKSSIDLVMYGLTDEQFVNALIKEKQKGINVNILLESQPYKSEDENKLAIQHLQAAHMNLQYPSHHFKLTHQKTFLIDKHSALVMTFNLTHSTFKNERNFALIIDDPVMVKEINQTFLADWQHKNILVNNPNLIWSPNNSRERILDFIKNATSEIKIYAQDISDYQVIGTLARAARSGKKIQIILSNFPERKNKKFDYMRKAGIDIHFSKKMIIHAKVIIIDRNRAILGSINLTKPSLNDNRELSLITREPLTISQLLKTFEEDWNEMNAFVRPKQSKEILHLLSREIKYMTRKLLTELMR